MAMKVPKPINDEIRRVLMEYWDPIGIKDAPMAQDEYDSYVSDIYQLLKSGANVSTIIEHLKQIISVNMGMEPKYVDNRRTAEELCAIPIS